MSEDLPAGWCTAPLEALTPPDGSIVYGIIQAGPEFPGGVPYVRPTELVNGGIDVAALKRTSPAIAKAYERASLRAGDIILAIVGTIGKLAVVPPELAGANITQSSARIRPGPGLAPGYLPVALASPQLRAQFDRAEFGLAVRRLNVSHVRQLEIPVPPLREQRRIVTKLEKLLARSRRTKDVLDAIPPLLEKLRQSVLDAAFRGDLTADWREQNRNVEPAEKFLARIRVERRTKWEQAELVKLTAKGKVPTDDRWKARYVEPQQVDASELPELPDGWSWAGLDELLTIMTSGSRGWSKYYGGGTGTFVMAQNVRPWTPDFSERQPVDPPPDDPERARTLVENGDLLLTIVGANTGDVCVVHEVPDEFYVCQSVALLRPVASILSWHLVAYLNTRAGGAGQLEKFAYGQGRPHLGFDQLRALVVPLPGREELAVLRSRLDEALARISPQQQQLDEAARMLDVLANAMLAKALRGELVPQDPNDEPAEVMLARLRADQAQGATNGQAPDRKRRSGSSTRAARRERST